MLALSHKITIGSNVYRSSDHSRMIGLHCSLDLAIPVNECRVVMTYPEGLNLETGQDIEVELGYDGDMEQVFKGKIGEIDWRIDCVIIEAMSSFRDLVTAKFNLFFDNPTSLNIVLGVTDEFDIAKGRMEPGILFSSYAIGDNVSAYDHLKFLAQQNGFDFYANESDKMVFARHIPGNVHLFQFGINILALAVDKVEESISKVEIFGASPASFGQGPLASSWLTKNVVKDAAGSGSGITKRIYDPTVKSQQNAFQVATSLLGVNGSRTLATLKTLGKPTVKIGDIASISNMPVQDQNGQFKVTGVNHHISFKRGYTTIIKLEDLSWIP